MNVRASFFGPLKRRPSYEKHPEHDVYFEYSHYRAAIAEDCGGRCVYCDSHEDTIGGREAMQLDHFRPWNKSFGASKQKVFEHLRDDPLNLVHACGVCNRFKAARWPTEDPDIPHDDHKGWIDPFSEVRSEFLSVDESGLALPAKDLGKYLIATLRLNRPLLRKQRELRHVVTALEQECVPKWQAVIAAEPDGEHAQTARVAIALLATIRSQCCPV